MEQSTLHIKAPHEVHIGAKARAALYGKSMNQYVIDLIKDDLGEEGLETTRQGIRLFRESTPAEKKVLLKASEVLEKMEVIKTPEDATRVVSTATGRGTPGLQLCKIHATPLDFRGKCLQKGCKYA